MDQCIMQVTWGGQRDNKGEEEMQRPHADNSQPCELMRPRNTFKSGTQPILSLQYKYEDKPVNFIWIFAAEVDKIRSITCSTLQNSFGVLKKIDKLHKLCVACNEAQTWPEVSRTRTLRAPATATAIQKMTPEFEQTNDQWGIPYPILWTRDT